MLILLACRNSNKVRAPGISLSIVTANPDSIILCGVRLADHIHNDILSPPLLLIGPQPPDQDRAGDFHLPVIGRGEDSQEGKLFSKPDI